MNNETMESETADKGDVCEEREGEGVLRKRLKDWVNKNTRSSEKVIGSMDWKI